MKGFSRESDNLETWLLLQRNAFSRAFSAEVSLLLFGKHALFNSRQVLSFLSDRAKSLAKNLS